MSDVFLLFYTTSYTTHVYTCRHGFLSGIFSFLNRIPTKTHSSQPIEDKTKGNVIFCVTYDKRIIWNSDFSLYSTVQINKQGLVFTQPTYESIRSLLYSNRHFCIAPAYLP